MRYRVVLDKTWAIIFPVFRPLSHLVLLVHNWPNIDRKERGICLLRLGRIYRKERMRNTVTYRV